MQKKPVDLLVIIDPQQDFLHRDGPYAKRHSGLQQMQVARQNIQQQINKQQQSVLVVYSFYQPEQFGEDSFLCIDGTAGCEIALDLAPQCARIVKHQHSCFTANEFCQYLIDNSIEHLLLCGFLAEYCVKQTALDGLAKGYRISIIQDCTGTADDRQELKNNLFAELAQKGAALV